MNPSLSLTLLPLLSHADTLTSTPTGVLTITPPPTHPEPRIHTTHITDTHQYISGIIPSLPTPTPPPPGTSHDHLCVAIGAALLYNNPHGQGPVGNEEGGVPPKSVPCPLRLSNPFPEVAPPLALAGLAS